MSLIDIFPVATTGLLGSWVRPSLSLGMVIGRKCLHRISEARPSPQARVLRRSIWMTGPAGYEDVLVSTEEPSSPLVILT